MSILQLASRILLQASPSDADNLGNNSGTPDTMPDSPDYISVPAESTLDLRIIAIFVIFAAAMIGGTPPLFIASFKNASHPATLVFRALSAGVILSLALIHVIGDGNADLEGVTDYPVGGCCVVFGIALMVILENLSHHFLMEKQHDHFHDGSSKGHRASLPDVHMEVKAGSQQHQHYHPTAPSAFPQGSELGRISDASVPVADDGHTHTCVAANTAANWASRQSVPMESTIRQQITAYVFELACVIHSFLIGLSLGVTVGNRGQALALLLALVFHQGLEGIGLGSVVVQAQFSTLKSVIMVATYAITTPVGVAIGIAVSSTYDPESITALAVQGVFNSVSGGLLLYISLVQLVAEDFTRVDGKKPRGLLLRLGTYTALLVGAAAMAVLALWA